MSEQSSSSNEKLSSGSSTSFHSPSPNAMSAVTEDDLSAPSTLSSHSEVSTVSTNDTTSSSVVVVTSSSPTYTSPTNAAYVCSTTTTATTENPTVVPTCVDTSLEDCCFPPRTMPTLTKSSSPSGFAVKEHSQIDVYSTTSVPKQPIFFNSLILKESIPLECAPCKCDDKGELVEMGGGSLPINPNPQQLSITAKTNPTKPLKTFDSLVSLSESVFQLKNYSLTYGNEPSSSSIFYTDESSPFLNERNFNSHVNKSSCSNPCKVEKNANQQKLKHYHSTYSNNIGASIQQPDHPSKSLLPPQPQTQNTQDSGHIDADTNNCHVCQKKLPIISIKCKCGLFFCSKHRHAESHKCTFDYKAEKKNYLRKNITPVVADKVRKI